MKHLKAKNKNEQKLKINMSIQEASNFWDEHDLTDFDDFKEVKPFKIEDNTSINYAEKIYKKVKQLPEAMQQQILDFVQFMKHRGNQES